MSNSINQRVVCRILGHRMVGALVKGRVVHLCLRCGHH